MDSSILNDIKKVVETKEEKKYIECSMAFAIADKHNIDKIELGRILNENKIKISQCQLGCF